MIGQADFFAFPYVPGYFAYPGWGTHENQIRAPPSNLDFLKLRLEEEELEELRLYRFFEKAYGKETRWYVAFYDGQKSWQEVRVTKQVYLEMQEMMRHERNLSRWDERHLEQLELSEEQLHRRVSSEQVGVAEQILSQLKAEVFWEAVEALPLIQRRRFLLYYEEKLTFTQIAKKEGCTKRAVKYSVDIAKEKLRNQMKISGF